MHFGETSNGDLYLEQLQDGDLYLEQDGDLYLVMEIYIWNKMEIYIWRFIWRLVMEIIDDQQHHMQ